MQADFRFSAFECFFQATFSICPPLSRLCFASRLLWWTPSLIVPCHHWRERTVDFSASRPDGRLFDFQAGAIAFLSAARSALTFALIEKFVIVYELLIHPWG